MNARTVAVGEMSPEQRRVHRVEHILRRDGGSPGGALEGLAAIVEDETWLKVPANPDDPRPFGSFTEFVESPFGLRYSVANLRALVALKHPDERTTSEVRERMERMRAEVARLLGQEIATALPAGRPEKNVSGTNNSSSARRNDAVAIVAKLKRDDPALAERVVRGELTANAAALQAGIRKPRILVTSPESVARSLRRHMSPADLARLAELLSGGGES